VTPLLSNKFIFLLLLFVSSGRNAGAEEQRPIWLVSNGFHTSIGVRSGDFPLRREVAGAAAADHLLIGWGGSEFYRGRANPWTLFKSISWPNPSALHVVPVRGSLARRFRRSEVIRLMLPSARHRELMKDLAASFARDSTGRLTVLGPGYFPVSRFYAGTERFCLFQMCNLWIARKLRRNGVRVFVPTAIAPSELMWQAARLGHREQGRRRPADTL
jgi:uncharacterized protein (TIGR02117 family)